MCRKCPVYNINPGGSQDSDLIVHSGVSHTSKCYDILYTVVVMSDHNNSVFRTFTVTMELIIFLYFFVICYFALINRDK